MRIAFALSVTIAAMMTGSVALAYWDDAEDFGWRAAARVFGASFVAVFALAAVWVWAAA